MVATLALENAVQVTVGCDDALDYFRSFEGVEAERLAANRHQAMGRGAAGRVDGDDIAGPTALQARQGEDTAGLKPLTEIAVATGQCEQKQGRSQP